MKVYPLGIVGESNYQPAIRRTREGEPARICHESDNPFDALALRVENDAGDVIGYVSRSSWLREAIHDEGRGVSAVIDTISSGDEGNLGVVLSVTLTDDHVPVRSYSPPTQPLLRVQPHQVLEFARDPLAVAREVLGMLSPKASCPCGERWDVAYAEMGAGSRISCPRCGSAQTFEQGDVDSMERDVMAHIARGYAELGLTRPSPETLRSAIWSGQLPAGKKRSWLRRILG